MNVNELSDMVRRATQNDECYTSAEDTIRFYI